MIFIALGSNMPSIWGPPDQTVKNAISQLRSHFPHDLRASQLYRTPAFPADTGPEFINAVVAVNSDASPQTIMEILHTIEQSALRLREQRWGARTLDLDLLSANECITPSEDLFWHWHNLSLEIQISHTPDQLLVPHPRIQDRAFVLIPLAEIAPDWRHPIFKKTATELLEALPAEQKGEVRLLRTYQTP